MGFAFWALVHVGIVLFGISFMGAGTGSNPEHDKWAKRSFFASLVCIVAAAIIFFV
jgi:hypothetical protein